MLMKDTTADTQRGGGIGAELPQVDLGLIMCDRLVLLGRRGVDDTISKVVEAT